MTIRALVHCIVFLALATSACSDYPVGSCFVASGGVCTDYTGVYYIGNTTSVAGHDRLACGAIPGGLYTERVRCSAVNRVGSCRVRPGDDREVILRYYAPQFTEGTAQDGCAATGRAMGASVEFTQ